MRKVLVAALVSICAAGSVAAQTAAPKTSAAKPRTPESIECSKQADAKGLHGKERSSFRAKCKRELAKKK
jgi:hypothetical protein